MDFVKPEWGNSASEQQTPFVRCGLTQQIPHPAVDPCEKGDRRSPLRPGACRRITSWVLYWHQPMNRLHAIIDSTMAQLIVRDIPQQIVVRLKQRAAQRGRSAEAEHREILRQVLLSPASPSLKAMLGAIPDVGRDADFQRPRRLGRRVAL
jgi:Plasmid stability protein